MDILAAKELLAEYAAECSIAEIGQINPQAEMYKPLEKMGVARAFGVFSGEEMIGFANVLHTVIPHYGKKVATVESIFIAMLHRSGGSGLALMAAIEDDAKTSECEAILYSAPVNSRFSRVLGATTRYTPTNTVYCRRLI